MTEPTVAVEIVRPKIKIVESLVTSALHALFRGWFLMLGLGAFTPWHLGFWSSVFAAAVVGTVVNQDDSWRLWTRDPKK